MAALIRNIHRIQTYEVRKKLIVTYGLRYTSITDDSVKKPPATCKIDEKILCDNGNVCWKPRRFFIHTLPFYYASASKIRVTSLMAFTTVGGCMMAPGPFDPYTTLLMGVSSILIGGAANSINQFMEHPHDSQMERTKFRVLPLGAISSSHVLAFGLSSFLLGSVLVAYNTNPLTLMLAIGNFLLYTALYTPMKQTSIYNTWVGSVVGAIPPLSGYTAITGHIDISSLFLPLLLYFWQFPHFNSLSWLMRDNYAKAGIKMMVHYDITLLMRVTVRYAFAMVLVCALMPTICQLTTSKFILTSFIPNIPVLYLSYRLLKNPNNQNSLILFKTSLIQLSILILLLIIHKHPLNTEENTTSSETNLYE